MRAIVIASLGAIVMSAASCAPASRGLGATRASAPMQRQALLALRPDVFVGAPPRQAEDVALLQRQGVRTIVHVDSLRPLPDLALDAGIVTVHIPVRFAGITREQQLALARVLRTARERREAVYFASRDASERAPAAAACALIVLGDLTPAQGLDALSHAGRGARGSGLHRSVREARVAREGELDALPWDAGQPTGEVTFAEGMAIAQDALSTLERLRDSNALAPREGAVPDASDAAARLRQGLAAATEVVESSRASPDFVRMLVTSLVRARALEEDLARSRGARPDPMQLAVGEELGRRLTDLASSCHACHAQFRDRTP